MGETVLGSSGSDSAKCLAGACGMESPKKPQRRRKQGLSELVGLGQPAWELLPLCYGKGISIWFSA